MQTLDLFWAATAPGLHALTGWPMTLCLVLTYAVPMLVVTVALTAPALALFERPRRPATRPGERTAESTPWPA